MPPRAMASDYSGAMAGKRQRMRPLLEAARTCDAMHSGVRGPDSGEVTSRMRRLGGL